MGRGSKIFSFSAICTQSPSSLCILDITITLAMGREPRSLLCPLFPHLHCLPQVPHPSRLFLCWQSLPSQNCLDNACAARSLPPESSCQAEVPPYPPLSMRKKGPERFCIPSPVRTGRIQHLSECFPRSGLFSAPGRWAMVGMLLFLPACPHSPCRCLSALSAH